LGNIWVTKGAIVEPTVTDWVQAIASVLTFGCAIAAVVIANRAPKLAASYAEQYRRETAQLDEARNFQIQVFRALMKGRAEIVAVDTRAAINLAEAAFPTDHQVRAARRLFTKAASANPFVPGDLANAYMSLLEAVTNAVGLGEKIDRFDLESGYYPEALGRLDEAALAEALAKISAHNQGQGKKH
jgi:hypothetical protein